MILEIINISLHVKFICFNKIVKTGVEFVVQAGAALFDEAGKIIQKIQGDIKNLGMLIIKNDFNNRIACIRKARDEINRFTSEIRQKESQRNRLNDEKNKCKVADETLSINVPLVETWLPDRTPRRS